MVRTASIVSIAIFTLVHLVGLVVAIILWARTKRSAAILSTAAFALLFIGNIGDILRIAFLDRLIASQINASEIQNVMPGLNCCCGSLSLIAVICLIIALWQALSAPAPAPPEDEEVIGEVV